MGLAEMAERSANSFRPVEVWVPHCGTLGVPSARHGARIMGQPSKRRSPIARLFSRANALDSSAVLCAPGRWRGLVFAVERASGHAVARMPATDYCKDPHFFMI